MGMLDASTLTRILLRKTDTELDTIASQAEQVAFGATSSISALSQSTTFSIESAGVILQAVEKVRAARAKDPNACADDMPEPSLGHSVRFQPVKPPQACTWGC